jgi:hypothetical protein
MPAKKKADIHISVERELWSALAAAAKKRKVPINREVRERLEASFRNDDLLPFTNYLLSRLVALGEPVIDVMGGWHGKASGRSKTLTIETEVVSDEG